MAKKTKEEVVENTTEEKVESTEEKVESKKSDDKIRIKKT